ncbi:MAG: hypothetical protein ABIP20_09850 [Chthoniobacteraceae bacterium]
MRAILPCLLLCLAIPAWAREWKNEIFHCAANIPESAGWQMIDAPPVPGLAPVLVMQNSARQTVFGINVVEKYRDANLAEPGIQKELEALLRQFGYEFVGHSNVTAGRITWLQYSVRAGASQPPVSGIIRFGSAGGYVFSITMLRGGGPEASQDVELQQAAASFRMLPAGSIAAGSAPGTVQPGSAEGKPSQNATLPKTANTPEKVAANEEESTAEDNSHARMIWAGAAALAVLVLFFGIIARKPSN